MSRQVRSTVRGATMVRHRPVPRYAHRWLVGLWLSCAACAPGCGADLYDRSHVDDANRWLANFATLKPVRVLSGRVSYYHDSLAGNLTANGEIYDPRVLSAASRTLAFGTVVRVVRTDSPQSVLVRINDRGPFGDKRRILDLSREAATRLGILRKGVAQVRAEILWQPKKGS